jgi:hypothetical protein
LWVSHYLSLETKSLSLANSFKNIMPESRKRPGHPFQKPADIPASQRVKGKIIWALLFGVFGLLMAYFTAGSNYKILIIVTLVAGAIGYFIGKKMEKKD